MSATSIYFNGIFTRVPGSYSKVDVSALDAVGISASGIVACVGTAIGGKPYTAVDLDDVAGTLQKSTRPGKASGFFQEGSNLLEAEALLFNPSKDDDIQAGAQSVFWVKVNESAASTATFANGDGDALTYTSQDYGYKTTQIYAEIATGSTVGKKYTIVLEDVTEVFDNVLMEVFSLLYTSSTPAEGFTTITGDVTTTKLTAAFTKANLGLDGEITTSLVGAGTPAKVEIVSAAAGDTTQVATLFGLDSAGTTAQSEQLTLTGTNAVTSSLVYSEILGVRLSAACAGAVTVNDIGGTPTLVTIAISVLTAGVVVCTDMPVAGVVIDLVSDGASTKDALVVGASETGAAAIEQVTLTGVTPVSTTGKWSRIDNIVLGDVEAAQTITASGTAVETTWLAYATLKKVSDHWNSKGGMTLTMVTGDSTFAMSNMDTDVSAQSLLATAKSWYANLYAAIVAITNGSDLVTPTRASGATGVPNNTTVAVYLTGGDEGDPVNPTVPTADSADWQAAYNLLKKVFVNSIVPLTPDPAIHAIHDAHLAYMCGAGRMERDGAVGLMNAGQTAVPTKSEIKTQIVALNSRHNRAVAQQCERFNAATPSVKTKFDPHYTACLAIGMQAGSEVGTSLTRKYINTLGIYGDTSWHPQDDADEMIELGLLFAEQIDGVGHRWVRNVTTKVSSTNIVYTEAEANEAVNYSVYNFRTQMEWAIGRKGFAGTEQAAEGVARNVLTQLTGLSLTSWRSLDLDLSLQILEVSVEMAPVLSIVFVENTIHIVGGTSSSAAS
jgi:hypothetical protein